MTGCTPPGQMLLLDEVLLDPAVCGQ